MHFISYIISGLIMSQHRSSSMLLFFPLQIHCRSYSSSKIQQKLSSWMNTYEDFVGLSSIKKSQATVIEAETDFLAVQQKRREHQRNLLYIQDRLRKLNNDLDKIPRSDDRYLKLLTEEHIIIKEEQQLNATVDELEQREREKFSFLSTALRDSNDKERAHSERTKYWSITGSCLGADIGVLGTTINNHRKMSQLRQMLLSKQEAVPSELNNTLHEVQASVIDLGKALNSCSQQSNKTLLAEGELETIRSILTEQEQYTDGQLILNQIRTTQDRTNHTLACGIISLAVLLASICVMQFG